MTTKFTKICSDNQNAPNKYLVRVDTGGDEGDKYIYYKTYKDIANIYNCSRDKIKQQIDGKRTIRFEELNKL